MSSSSSTPLRAANTLDIEKIWEIQCKDQVNTFVAGGICVDARGYILTAALGILDPEKAETPIELRGRSHSSCWNSLEIIHQKKNFNLTLLKSQVNEAGKKFPYFDLNLGGVLHLERGDELCGVLHCKQIPFSFRYGSVCLSYTDDDVPDIDMDSTNTFFNTDGNQREEVLSGDLKYLCVGHTIDRGESDDESDEVSYLVPNAQLYLVPNAHYLDPNMPVIQSKGLGLSSNGCFGCPIFNAKMGFVGLYLFYEGDYQYIIPQPFLTAFFTHAMVLHKKEGKMKIDDSSPDNKDEKRRKSLNEATKLTHKPREIHTIPHFTEAWYAHERLLQRLQEFGFEEMKVTTDGNCQFSALAQLIYGSPNYHEKVREAVVEQLKAGQASYQAYVRMKYAKYLTKMAESGEWGDHITLQAAADKFAVSISLITLLKYKDDTCLIEIAPQDQVPMKDFYLSHWSKVYYNPLRKN